MIERILVCRLHGIRRNLIFCIVSGFMIGIVLTIIYPHSYTGRKHSFGRFSESRLVKWNTNNKYTSKARMIIISGNIENKSILTPDITILDKITQSAIRAYSSTKPVCADPLFWTFRREKRFIIHLPVGQLGNFMFTYASTYGIAAHLNRSLVMERYTPFSHYFNLDAIMADHCVLRKAKHKYTKTHCAFDKGMFNIKRNKNYKVGLYLQSWKYFEAVVPQIKKQFTFKAVISNKAQAIINKISDEYLKKKRVVNVTHTSNNITFVGIHVRRGDITYKRNIKSGYMAASKEYIDRAMLYFTNNFTNVLFVVCSDNMTWAEANIKHSDVFYVNGNSPEVDMSVLIHCNHTIITTGTFGWWSGFLAGGITVYFKYPAKEGSKLRKHFSEDYADYFYPGWIGMK